MTLITLPKRGRGRPSAKAQANYDVKVEEFCRRLLEIQSGLDFKPGEVTRLIEEGYLA